MRTKFSDCVGAFAFFGYAVILFKSLWMLFIGQ